MMNRCVLGLALAAMMALATACSDPMLSGLNVRIATRTSVEELLIFDAAGKRLIVHEAWLHLREIDIGLPDGKTCADMELFGRIRCESAEAEEKMVVTGPFAIDLVAGTSTPELENRLGMSAGFYRRLDLRPEDGDPQDGLIEPGDKLDGRSLVVRASFDHQGTPTALELSLSLDGDIRIEEPGTIDVTIYEILIAELVASAWLEEVKIDECLASGELMIQDDKLVIDESLSSSQCSGIKDTIKESVKRSGVLVRKISELYV